MSTNNSGSSKLSDALGSMSAAELMNDPIGMNLVAAMNGGNSVQPPIAAALNGEQRLASAARTAGVEPVSLEAETFRSIMQESEFRAKRGRIMERVVWIAILLFFNFDVIGTYSARVKPYFDASGKRTLVKVKQIMDSSNEALEVARARVIEIDEELIDLEPGLQRYELETEKGKQLIAITTLDDTYAHYKLLHEKNMSMTDSSITVESMTSWAKKNPGKTFGVEE